MPAENHRTHDRQHGLEDVAARGVALLHAGQEAAGAALRTIATELGRSPLAAHPVAGQLKRAVGEGVAFSGRVLEPPYAAAKRLLESATVRRPGKGAPTEG